MDSVSSLIIGVYMLPNMPQVGKVGEVAVVHENSVQMTCLLSIVFVYDCMLEEVLV